MYTTHHIFQAIFSPYANYTLSIRCLPHSKAAAHTSLQPTMYVYRLHYGGTSTNYMCSHFPMPLLKYGTNVLCMQDLPLFIAWADTSHACHTSMISLNAVAVSWGVVTSYHSDAVLDPAQALIVLNVMANALYSNILANESLQTYVGRLRLASMGTSMPSYFMTHTASTSLYTPSLTKQKRLYLGHSQPSSLKS